MSSDIDQKRRKQDVDDLNHEIAGVDVGRLRRFLTADDDRIGPDGKTRRQRREEDYSRLQWLLLSDLHYFAVYQRADQRLHALENAADRAYARFEKEHAAAIAAHTALLDRAARLPDGTAVFRDQNGRVWTEDGRELDAIDAAQIEWRGHEPSYESFLASQEAIALSEQAQVEVGAFRTDTLGSARDRLENQDDPMSADAIEQMLEDIETRIPDAVISEIELAPTLSDGAQLTSALALPPLGR